MIKALIDMLLRFRLLFIFLMIASTLIFGYYLTKIQVDNDTFKAVPPKLKAKLDYENLKKEFPSPYNILFLAEFKSGSLSEKIDSLRAWEKDFITVPGIIGVSDLNTVQIPIKGGFFGMTSDYLVSRKTDQDEGGLRERIAENKEFSKLFISTDENIMGMVLALQESANRSAIISRVIAKSNEINTTSHITTYLTSEGAISYFIDQTMRRDFRVLLPICLLIVFLLLYRIFRNILYVFAALTVNILALIWTFGLIGMTDTPFSIVSSIIPVILFPIGVADAIHILKTYAKQKANFNGKPGPALTATYKEMLLPCFLTSLTTFAGFASFIFSDISWTRTFGLFTGISVIFAYFFNVVLIPLFVAFEKPNATAKYSVTSEEKWLDKFWDTFSKFTLESKRWIWLFPVLAIMFVIGFKMVHVQSNPIEMLPEKSMLRMSDNFISKHFGGTRFFSVVLENNGLTLTNQEQWEKVQEIAAFIKKQEGVGTVSSIIPLLTRTSSLISSEPLSNAAISMITSSKGIFGKNYSTYIKGFLSESKSKTRLTVQCSNDAGIHPLEIAKNIETHIEQTYKGWDVLVSGPAILNEAMASVLIKTQISSLISTFIPVFLCLALFFKSFRVGIFSIIPIIFSTAFVYAMMGLLGVTINLVTVIIMNTSIGIGIDYAIHFISGYLYCRKNYNNRIDAIKHTIKSKGTPILFNTFVVGIGFLILMFSTFPPIKDFGTVIFVSMFVSAVFSILFISILISLFGMGDKFLVRKDIA